MKTKQFNLNVAMTLCVLTSTSAFSQSPSETFDITEFNTAVAAEHNAKRNIHHTAPLNLDATLTGDAQVWAEHLLSTGTLAYDPNTNAGENLYVVTRSLPAEPPMSAELIALYKQYYPNWEQPVAFTGADLASAVTEAWYSEVQNYNYVTTQSNNGNAVGHFTQMVWKDSTKQGCGAAWQTIQNGTMIKAYVVCRYQSAGNVVTPKYGQSYQQARIEDYSANVLMP